jgi:iron-sulfur cluster assembly protein
MAVTTATEAQPINITASAGAQLNRIKSEQNIPDDHALRVGVKGGGCSGFSYILGFDKVKDRDQRYTVSGLDIIIDKAHAIYLLGIEIDWMDGLNNRGFIFNNPNAKDTCGCGTSFSA